MGRSARPARRVGVDNSEPAALLVHDRTLQGGPNGGRWEADGIAVAGEPGVGAAEKVGGGGALDVGTAAPEQAASANAAINVVAPSGRILVTR